MPAPIRRLTPKLVLLVASLALCALVAEVALRAIGFDPLGGLLNGREIILQPSENPSLRYVPRAGATGYAWEAEIEINSLGFREREVGPKDSYRVVSIGDSITFGNRLPVEDRYTEQLEEMAGVDVVNMGVGGYDTLQEVAFLEESGLPLDPDLVVLQYCVNDAGVMSANLRYIEQMQSLDSPLYRLRLAQFVRVYGDRILAALSFFRANQAHAFERTYAEEIMPIGDDPQLVEWVDEMERLDASDTLLQWYASPERVGRVRQAFAKLGVLSRKHDVPVVVVVVPYLGEHRGDYRRVYDLVEHLARWQQFDVVRIDDALDELGAEALRISDDDPLHPNATGHRLIAEALAARVAQAVGVP